MMPCILMAEYLKFFKNNKNCTVACEYIFVTSAHFINYKTPAR